MSSAPTGPLRPAIVIPFYNHEKAIGQTVAGLRRYGLPCWIVDDGSDPRCAPVLEELVARENAWLRLLRYQPNQGKGEAVMRGLRAALDAGCSHGVQIDADGQHDPAGLEALLAAARQDPQAVVCGVPVYDASVPRSRLYGRYVTHVWVWINTLSLQIADSMCGFRVYPLAPALALWDAGGIGRRMQFDTDILVRLHWRGLRVSNVPVRVTYPLDGVSHFDLWRDNLRISGMHARLFFGMLLRLPLLLGRRFRGGR